MIKAEPQPMPDMDVTPYEKVRPKIEPGMVAFFSTDTSGLKKLTPIGFVCWRIKLGQTPPHECTHVGILDVVHSRRVLLEATTPVVRISPLSGQLGMTQGLDGKWAEPFDGKLYIGWFKGCWGVQAVSAAWHNLLLPYDYLDLVAIGLKMPRRDVKRYICSELVAEALKAGGVCPMPKAGTAYTPADLMRHPKLQILWRLR